jgi:hypothetical protein
MHDSKLFLCAAHVEDLSKIVFAWIVLSVRSVKNVTKYYILKSLLWLCIRIIFYLGQHYALRMEIIFYIAKPFVLFVLHESRRIVSPPSYLDSKLFLMYEWFSSDENPLKYNLSKNLI